MAAVRLIVVICFFYQTTFAYQPSNVMFLGDSLTDIGNFPQATAIWNYRYNDVAQNAFIPATNPINLSILKKLSIDGEIFDYPLPDDPYFLPPLIPIEHQQKLYRSVNWTEFLLYDLKGKTAKVIPRQMYAQDILLYGKDISVNYAWWAAVTGKGCYNEDYRLVKYPCKLGDITGYQQEMHQHIVPGIQTQVEWIHADAKSGRIYTDENTLYIIYAGGNGLYQAQNQFDKFSLSAYWKGVSLFGARGAEEVAEAVSQLTKPPLNAKHIVVINLYDLSLTPRIVSQRWLGFITHSFSRLFNYRLRKAIRKQKFDTPGVEIKIFDNYSFFHSLANAEFFKTTLGKQCDGHTKVSPYYQTAGDTHNCFVDDNHGYLFWNNSHPSTLAHAKLARALSHWMLGNSLMLGQNNLRGRHFFPNA